MAAPSGDLGQSLQKRGSVTETCFYNTLVRNNAILIYIMSVTSAEVVFLYLNMPPQLHVAVISVHSQIMKHRIMFIFLLSATMK